MATKTGEDVWTDYVPTALIDDALDAHHCAVMDELFPQLLVFSTNSSSDSTAGTGPRRKSAPKSKSSVSSGAPKGNQKSKEGSKRAPSNNPPPAVKEPRQSPHGTLAPPPPFVDASLEEASTSPGGLKSDSDINSSASSSSSSSAGAHRAPDKRTTARRVAINPPPSTDIKKRWGANLNVLLRFGNVLKLADLQPVWHKLTKSKREKERIILQNACRTTAGRLKLACQIIPAGFCQNLIDLTLSYADPLSLFHGISIWFFPKILLA